LNGSTAASETRITTYLGIIQKQIPAKQYFALWRTFPNTCDWSWQESQAVGVTRTYLGTDVFEGAYPYRGMSIVRGGEAACSRSSCRTCSSPSRHGHR